MLRFKVLRMEKAHGNFLCTRSLLLILTFFLRKEQTPVCQSYTPYGARFMPMWRSYVIGSYMELRIVQSPSLTEQSSQSNDCSRYRCFHCEDKIQNFWMQRRCRMHVEWVVRRYMVLENSIRAQRAWILKSKKMMMLLVCVSRSGRISGVIGFLVGGLTCRGRDVQGCGCPWQRVVWVTSLPNLFSSATPIITSPHHTIIKQKYREPHSPSPHTLQTTLLSITT